jgi:tRNA dimethylallyltransferase
MKKTFDVSSQDGKVCSKGRPDILFIVGPSAAGKSAVAIELARRLDGEIISCDAMQVYKEALISTDRPCQECRRGIRHHLEGHVSVEEEFNAALYREQALGAVEDIRSRGRMPIVCGGSGMYVTALLDGLLERGDPDAALRARFEAEADEKGLAVLHARLDVVDPQAARRINPSDRTRIIRALEVFESTGEPISVLQKARSGLWGRYQIRIFCLDRERKELYQRAEDRIEGMFTSGLEDEVKFLLRKKLARSASRIIGVPELRDYFSGRCSLEEAKGLMKQNTRRYIKRQLTWFRKDARLEWIRITPDMSVEDVTDIIMEML